MARIIFIYLLILFSNIVFGQKKRDVAPTLLDIVGLQKHPQMTGKSFKDILF